MGDNELKCKRVLFQNRAFLYLAASFSLEKETQVNAIKSLVEMKLTLPTIEESTGIKLVNFKYSARRKTD